jgi:hypothetical protein
MSSALFKLGIVAAGGLAVVVFRWQAKRRAAAQELAGGCVACGSQSLQIADETTSCMACGYVGRADRGGTLASHEIDAIYDHSHSHETERERGW